MRFVCGKSKKKNEEPHVARIYQVHVQQYDRDHYGTNVTRSDFASAGTVWFKETRKSTPFATLARRRSERADKATKFGLREIEVKVKGGPVGPRSQ